MSKAQEIADEVIAKHDADLAYPNLMHMSQGARFDRYFLRFADEADARKGASLVDTYAAAELLLQKYGPSYALRRVRTQTTFS